MTSINVELNLNKNAPRLGGRNTYAPAFSQANFDGLGHPAVMNKAHGLNGSIMLYS